MTRPHAIIFDLDGTLLDTMPDLTAAVNVALGRQGRDGLGRDEVAALVGHGLRALADDVRTAVLARDAAGDAEAGGEALDSERLFVDLIDYYEAHSLDLTRPYPGILYLLERLAAAGIRLGVVSNKQDELCRAVVAHFFDEQFDIVLGMRPDLAPKPAPDMALAAARHWQLDPARIAYVGDAPTDVRAALAAGMRSIGVSWGYRSAAQLREAGATEIVDDCDALALALGLDPERTED